MTTHDDTTSPERHNWDSLRERLERERAELVDQLELPADDLHAVTATTGQGETEHIVSEVEQRVQAVLDAAAVERLAELNDALRRLDDGTYGICERCGKPIPMARLEALPQVRLCIECQEVEDAQLRR
ncbi:MAG TPA: TraR/DksA family transcriptional regulator [Acidimicrobiia bacterium]|nr:TraR/DksA family transcriptional regulator [Acidimicrobiia bacterium]